MCSMTHQRWIKQLWPAAGAVKLAGHGVDVAARHVNMIVTQAWPIDASAFLHDYQHFKNMQNQAQACWKIWGAVHAVAQGAIAVKIGSMCTAQKISVSLQWCF